MKIAVHDWLLEYIFQGDYHYVFNGAELVLGLKVSMVSGFVHAYLLVIKIRFLLLSIGCHSSWNFWGVKLIFRSMKNTNTAAIGTGNGITPTPYHIEASPVGMVRWKKKYLGTGCHSVSWTCPGTQSIVVSNTTETLGNTNQLLKDDLSLLVAEVTVSTPTCQQFV